MERLKRFAREQKYVNKFEAVVLFCLLLLIFLSMLSGTAMIVG